MITTKQYFIANTYIETFSDNSYPEKIDIMAFVMEQLAQNESFRKELVELLLPELKQKLSPLLLALE